VSEREDERPDEVPEEGVAEGAPAETGAIAGIETPIVKVSAQVVRDWVRAMMVPPALKRMYEIGMGVTKFEVPTMAGNVVQVGAPASVQQKALAAVIALGVPPQVGIADGSEDETPGVLAVGEWELQDAREAVHSSRAALPPGVVPAEPEPSEPANEPASDAGEPAYRPPEGHGVVEVIERGDGTSEIVNAPAEALPARAPDTALLAKLILAKRRLAKKRSAHATREAPDSGEASRPPDA
jgi:hypothetical protein